jgi:hypothetical protein
VQRSRRERTTRACGRRLSRGSGEGKKRKAHRQSAFF